MKLVTAFDLYGSTSFLGNEYLHLTFFWRGLKPPKPPTRQSLVSGFHRSNGINNVVRLTIGTCQEEKKKHKKKDKKKDVFCFSFCTRLLITVVVASFVFRGPALLRPILAGHINMQ